MKQIRLNNRIPMLLRTGVFLLAVALSALVPAPAQAAAKTTSAENPYVDGLEVYFMDVGQGDSTLILCGNAAMLIDGGALEYTGRVQGYLSSKRIKRLDYVVCTHPDEDHMGALPNTVRNTAAVGQVLCSVSELSELDRANDNGWTKDVELFDSLKQETEKRGLQITVPAADSVFPLGDATVTVLGPRYDSAEGNKTLSDNNRSLVLKVTYGNTSLLLLADSEQEEQQQILSAVPEGALKCDILRMSHHGSNTGLCEDMVFAADPQYAVISVGRNNRYNHPSEGVIYFLKGAGIPLYRTDKHRTIIIRSDGETITFGENTVADWEQYTFVVNVKSGVYHYSDCKSVFSMLEKNGMPTNETAEALEAAGYHMCKNCAKKKK